MTTTEPSPTPTPATKDIDLEPIQQRWDRHVSDANDVPTLIREILRLRAVRDGLTQMVKLSMGSMLMLDQSAEVLRNADLTPEQREALEEKIVLVKARVIELGWGLLDETEYDSEPPRVPYNDHGSGRTCHDCGAPPGALHHPGCDDEWCSICGGQFIACPCGSIERDDD